MELNSKISEEIAVLATINPVSQGAGTATSGWVSVSTYHRFLALIQTGVLGASATVDAKIQQAVDSSGTSAKDVTGKALTQLVKASNDNNQALINLRVDELDTANGFDYIQLSVTVGTAASLISAALLATCRFDPASGSNQAGVVQVVG